MANIFQRVYNAVSNPIGGSPNNIRSAGGSKSEKRNLENYVLPVQLMRVVQTIGNWRQATSEAEFSYYPYRVKMQQLYNDLQDEPHLYACMERRMDLTLMRDYELVNKNGIVNDEWTEWLKGESWFINYQRYCLTSLFRGYSLVSIGDIINNGLPQLKLIEHSVISPDREYVGSVVYSPNGLSWNEQPYKDWHIWVGTTPEIGRGVCGYGLFHKVAVATIILRNNLSDNATYNERFGMPILWGKTDKTDDEKLDFFNQLKNMGAAGTFVTDTLEELEALTTNGGGQGFKSYADLEMRCQKLISKVILGHSDTLDSIPKRSGASEGNSQTPTTPVSQALSEIKSKDGKFIEPYCNQIIDLLRYHGVSIPKDLKFKYKNDEEVEEAKRITMSYNKSIADLAKTLKDSGLTVSPEWVESETGIPVTAAIQPKPVPPISATKVNAEIPKDIQNRLNSLYHNH